MGSRTCDFPIQSSLERLQTNYIDVFYLHVWDYTVSIPELMLGLNVLVSSGKVNHLGISDTPAWVVAKANQYARNQGLRQFSVYQGMRNAGMHDFERDIIPMAAHEGMALAPYGTLGQGSFQTRELFDPSVKDHMVLVAETVKHNILPTFDFVAPPSAIACEVILSRSVQE